MKKDLFTVALQNSVKSGSVSALNEKTLKACEMNPKDYKDTVNALYRAVLNGNEEMIFRAGSICFPCWRVPTARMLKTLTL